MCFGDIWVLTHRVTINLSFNSQPRQIIQKGLVNIQSSLKAKYFIEKDKKETHRSSHLYIYATFFNDLDQIISD